MPRARRGLGNELEKLVDLTSMFGGESLGRGLIPKRDNARRASVEVHRNRLSVPVEHLMRTNARDQVAAFHRIRIGRTQWVTLKWTPLSRPFFARNKLISGGV